MQTCQCFITPHMKCLHSLRSQLSVADKNSKYESFNKSMVVHQLQQWYTAIEKCGRFSLGLNSFKSKICFQSFYVGRLIITQLSKQESVKTHHMKMWKRHQQLLKRNIFSYIIAQEDTVHNNLQRLRTTELHQWHNTKQDLRHVIKIKKYFNNKIH